MGETFQCPKCPLSFSRVNGLNRHINQSHAEGRSGPVKCGTCRRRMPGPHTLGCAKARNGAPTSAPPKAKKPAKKAPRPKKAVAVVVSAEPVTAVPALVDPARTLLCEKLDEALADARADVRALERLAERLKA